MERILNERMAEKKHSNNNKRRTRKLEPSLKDGDNKITALVEPPGIICTPTLSDTLCCDEEKNSHLLSKTIDTMIDIHIRKTFGSKGEDDGENSGTPTRFFI